MLLTAALLYAVFSAGARNASPLTIFLVIAFTFIPVARVAEQALVTVLVQGVGLGLGIGVRVSGLSHALMGGGCRALDRCQAVSRQAHVRASVILGQRFDDDAYPAGSRHRGFCERQRRIRRIRHSRRALYRRGVLRMGNGMGTRAMACPLIQLTPPRTQFGKEHMTAVAVEQKRKS